MWKSKASWWVAFMDIRNIYKPTQEIHENQYQNTTLINNNC